MENQDQPKQQIFAIMAASSGRCNILSQNSHCLEAYCTLQ